MRHKLYYLGQPGEGFGWGVANTNLIKHLKEFCDVECAPRTRKKFDAPVFAPIQHQDLRPDVQWNAPRIIGYCFAEWPLPDKAKRHARAYDLIFAGSSWNLQRLKEAGIHNGDVLLQGIDADIFKPMPPTTRKGFVIFSGGKFEYRKGQDYVIAGMRLFMAEHKDAVLICSWENPWQQSVLSMRNSWLIDFDDIMIGLPEDRVIVLPPVSNKHTPQIYGQAHIGVFPNRCEAGTNLVMSEFMACERPVIASYAHGHKDVFNHSACAGETANPKKADGKTETAAPVAGARFPERCPEPSDYPLLLRTGQYDPAGWFNPEVCDIVSQLEWAYHHRDKLPELGRICREMTTPLTWRSCAEKIFRASFKDLCPGSKAKSIRSDTTGPN